VAGADAPATRPRAEWLPALAIGIATGILPAISRSPAAMRAMAGALVTAPVLWIAFSRPREWPLLFCGAAILLPPAPFAIGDSGAHASILIAAAGLLGGMASLREWRIRRSGLNAALAAYLGALALSLGWAALYSGAAIAAQSAARVILLGTGVYVYFTASQGPAQAGGAAAARGARALFRIAAAAAIFGCLDFLYQLPAPAGFGAQYVWLSTGVYRRAQGLFYDASALGNFCAFFFVMSVVAFTARKVLSRLAAAFGIALFLAAMLLSFSRAAVGAAAIACCALAVVERRRWPVARVGFAAAALVSIAVLVFAAMPSEFASTYIARLGFAGGAGVTPERFFSGRLETWKTIGGFLAEHPWQILTGIGYKTLPYTQRLGKPVIADNMYLSTLVETGVFGLGALLGLNAAILGAAYRAARRGSFFGKWMFCFWAGEVFQMMLGDVLTFWRVLPVYFWVLAQVVSDESTAG